MENLKIRIPITKVDLDDIESITPSPPSDNTYVSTPPSLINSIYNSSSSSTTGFAPTLDITKLNYYHINHKLIKGGNFDCLKNVVICLILLPMIPIVIIGIPIMIIMNRT
jgi:hypothetical protein